MEKKMCLSKVYVKKIEEDTPVVEEAAKVIYNDGSVEVHTLFGEKKVLQGYFIKELDLLKNYIILGEKGVG
jgi:predicted RNA-binding protein